MVFFTGLGITVTAAIIMCTFCIILYFGVTEKDMSLTTAMLILVVSIAIGIFSSDPGIFGYKYVGFPEEVKEVTNEQR